MTGKKNTGAPHWLAQLEAALELLRRASLPTWLCCAAGSAPFVLVLVYYLLETLQSALARRRLVGLSLALSLAFIWKQCWQAAFVARLRDELAAEASPWTGARLFHLITRQAFWQPWALVLLPASLLAVAPLPIAFSFFRELALAAGRGEPLSWRGALRASTADAKAHGFALASVALLGILLWVNLLVVIILVPMLGQSLFGIVTAWSQMGSLLANRVMLGVAAVLTWMLLDPLLDAFYLQRSFRQESRVNGADLTAALRRVGAVALVLIALAPALPAQTLDPNQIDDAAKKVLAHDDYVWRKAPGVGDDGPILSWFKRVNEWIEEKVDGVFDWFRKIFRRDSPNGAEGEGQGVTGALQWLLYGLSAVIIALAVVLFYRSWRRSRALRSLAPAPAAVSKVDVADESVAADALEESGWLQLADELIARGEYRLALRALHLAGLRYLGGKGFVSLARWKSGYDYQRELDRRLRATPQVPELFSGNLLRFEMVWYGRHAATPESVQSAREAWKEIRTHAS